MVTATPARTRYRFERFELLPRERQLRAEGSVVRVGPHAFDLLVVLVERSGELVTKDELLTLVWPRAVVEENTLQVHVSALRKLLGAQAIATVAGRGYRFALDVAHDAARAAGPRHNLPQPITSFIGRETEIAQIKHLLTVTRLLALTGAGGCGKTRLALQVAGAIADSYADGVWFVELAPLADPALVPQAVAQALQVEEERSRPLGETLASALASRHLLVVLDNAEHLLAACAQLADHLLRRCSRLGFLVTSRERLGIAGELTYRVPSLSVPDARQDVSRSAVRGCEAGRLFIERARLHRPDFDVMDKDLPALASICRRLDGIALAIELVAPRVRAMSIEELSGRIDRRFGLLTGGSRAALPRHRTLRSLIDWSHDLLGDAEKAVFRRASVFAGGWTLEAAAPVCAEDSDSRAVLDLLTSLSDKHLFTTDTRDGVTRFGMLESVRHYAHDQLSDSGEEQPVRARHAVYFMDIAQELAVPQSDAERQAKLSRVDKEIDNLRGAMAWCEADAARSADGMLLAGNLLWFWKTRGHFTEGRAWLSRFLARAPNGERDRAHGKAHATAGELAYFQEDFTAAEAHWRELLAIGRQLGNPLYVLAALGNLGAGALARAEHATARELLEQALASAREIGDPRSIASLLQNLGNLAHSMGDYERAQALLEEGIPISRQVGSWTAAEMFGQLAWLKHAMGDHQGARTLLMESMEGQREFENKAGVAKTLVRLASVAHELGDVRGTITQIEEALLILQELSADRVSTALALEIFAGLLTDLGQPLDAARLWGFACSLRKKAAIPQLGSERERSERRIAAARSALRDDAAFDLAWDEGSSWTQAEALRFAGEHMAAQRS